jgi:hypothetical protein
VAGAGTLQPIKKSQAAVTRYAKRSPIQHATENAYRVMVAQLERNDNGERIDAVAETTEASTGRRA